jgi:hypothetical protein
MPASKLPTPQDAAARRIMLDGLARDAGLSELVTELAPLHPRDSTFPGEVFLHLAADVLDWCGASRQQPLALEGIRERFLPECTFRGRRDHKLQFAVLAAAALRGGAEPDLLDEVAWWQTDDFWQYALFAAVGYVRAVAGRAGVPVRQACQQLAQRPGYPAQLGILDTHNRGAVPDLGLRASSNLREPPGTVSDSRGRDWYCSLFPD